MAIFTTTTAHNFNREPYTPTKILSGALVLYLLSGCAVTKINIVARDADKLKHVQKVAVMPFVVIWPGFMPLTEDPDEGDVYPVFMKKAKSSLAKKYDFVDTKAIKSELQRVGFKIILPNKQSRPVQGAWPSYGAKFANSGYTIPDALNIGKSLNADAVLLCISVQAVSMFFSPRAFNLRMVDVQSGKVILGINAYVDGNNGYNWNDPPDIGKIIKAWSENIK